MPLETPELDPIFARTLAQLKPTFDIALDPICVVDGLNRIVYANPQMKSFLGLKAKDIRAMPVFCERIRFAACEKECRIMAALRKNERIALDEVPATRGREKLRIWLRGAPLSPLGGAGTTAMVITLRDTTAELVLHAKYHKLVQVIAQREEQIRSLEQRVTGLYESMRKARER